MNTLRLLAKADRRVRLGHAWIFSNEIDVAKTPLTGFASGALADVRDARNNPIGIAYVNPAALICARLLTRNIRASIDAAWFERRLRRALALRDVVYPAPQYRLVYGESDGLPGVVIDRFAGVVSVQLNTAGALALRTPLLDALARVIEPDGVMLSNAASVRALEGIDALDETIGSVPEVVEVSEGGARLCAPLRAGQKTGYYYDQRDNRARLVRYVRPGARVLDVFSYVGAWAVAAGRAGAGEVTCIDSSESALGFARQNGEENGVAITVLRGDAVEVLEHLAAERRRFDVVVLDPPALVKRRKDQPAGEAHYERLHRAAMRLLEGGGTVISASCSHHVDAARLQRIALDAARHEGRPLQVLERHAHPPDHPIHPAMPETEYLKALYLRL